METTNISELETNTQQPEQKKKKSVWRIIGDVVFWTIIAFLGSACLINGIDQMSGYKVPFFGYRRSVIVSESMSQANPNNTYLDESMHQIQKYDVILTKTYKSYDDIKLYDVITYYSSKNGLVCHRVVDKYENESGKYLVTRGDANNDNDVPFEYSNVRGKVIRVTPKVGRVVLFMQSPYFLIAFFGSGFFILLGMFIYDYEKDKKKLAQTSEKPEVSDSKGIECELIPEGSTEKKAKEKHEKRE